MLDIILVANKRFRVILEGIAHELSNTIKRLVWTSNRFLGMINLPPDDHFIKHATPDAGHSRAQFVAIDLHRVIVEQDADLVVHF